MQDLFNNFKFSPEMFMNRFHPPHPTPISINNLSNLFHFHNLFIQLLFGEGRGFGRLRPNPSPETHRNSRHGGVQTRDADGDNSSPPLDFPKYASHEFRNGLGRLTIKGTFRKL